MHDILGGKLVHFLLHISAVHDLAIRLIQAKILVGQELSVDSPVGVAFVRTIGRGYFSEPEFHIVQDVYSYSIAVAPADFQVLPEGKITE